MKLMGFLWLRHGQSAVTATYQRKVGVWIPRPVMAEAIQARFACPLIILHFMWWKLICGVSVRPALNIT